MSDLHHKEESEMTDQQYEELADKIEALEQRIARLESGQFNEQAFAALDDSVKRALLGIPDAE